MNDVPDGVLMCLNATPRRRLAALSSVASRHQADSLLRLATRRLDAARYGRRLRDRPWGSPGRAAVPVHELDDDTVGIGDLEGAFTPGLLAQRHGDGDSFGGQAGQLGLEVVDHEGEDHAVGMVVALVVGQRCQAAAEEDDVHAGVLAGQRHEPVGGHLLTEPEMAGQEGSGRGDVLDVEGNGRRGDVHGGLLGEETLYYVHCTSYREKAREDVSMPTARSSAGDPARTLKLLWRE